MIIFSNKKVDGVDGIYANPAMFNGYFDGGHNEVMTNIKAIREIAKSKGLIVKDFPKQPSKQAEAATEPKPSVDEVKTESVEKPKRRTRKKKAE